MEVDRVDKRELLRLNAGSWMRRNSAHRWELMCRMRDEGKSWEQMGAWISRHWTTAVRLWRRGWVERQKKRAVCETCETKMTRFTTYPRYISPNRRAKPERVVYGGHCPKCDKRVWSRPFKVYSYEMVPPAGCAPATTRLKVGCSSI